MALSLFAPSAAAWPKYPRATGLDALASKMPQSTLPAPTADLKLKYVLLGLGTQNYTCTAGNDSAVPFQPGAVAKLYDIGTQLNKDPWAQFKIPTISGLALSLSNTPWGSSRLLDEYLKQQGYNQILGNHYFTLTVPTFSLSAVKSNPYPLAMVTKAMAVDAPKWACPGTTGEGAVKWVQLIDSLKQSVGGVNTVYRLETAGGNPPATCKGQKQAFEVPYAAQYWIYGPK
ncbi:hypothetical protein K458DRAFT_390220 [Lentithecium fluviatile CBS 122367]|uniref:DUF3455 domain-containing protein n=1 Tax=Lentithecium fluviatile CBS 122367 TaxID=1168545 RepID=A0A6G1IXH9_9PLEO|nr:hypothetical protein K458DRAFT_390220 [Lentithecium fluviatile CBS 122367]